MLLSGGRRYGLVLRIFYGDDQKVVFASEDLLHFKISNYMNSNNVGKIRDRNGRK